MRVTATPAPQQVTAASAPPMPEGSVSISERNIPSVVAGTHYDSQQNQGWFKSLGSRLVTEITSIPEHCSSLKTRTVEAVQNLGASIKSIPDRIKNSWITLKDCSVRVVQCAVIIGKETVKGAGIGGIVGTGAALITTILCPPLSPTMPYTISFVAGTGAVIGFQRGLAEASLIWSAPPPYALFAK